MRVLTQIWRGCGSLPHVGNHPGTAICVGLTLITGLAGAQSGGLPGFCFGAALGCLVYGPMYLYGAYSRAELRDNLMKGPRHD